MNPISLNSGASARELAAARDEVAKRHGAWTSHCIHLGQGVYTREQLEPMWRVEMFRIIMRDFGFRSLDGVRILDLACLEGLFAIEFAREGAVTVGIEGRESNLAKAIFTRDVLGLTQCTFIHDDVRNLRAHGLGEFDVVLCAGILYHLEAGDAVDLMGSISQHCSRLAIFDTHIAPDELRSNEFLLTNPPAQVALSGTAYEGRYFQEHTPGTSASHKQGRVWASLDNDRSFWFSKRSLHTALGVAGFTGIYDAMRDISRPVVDIDRVIFAALK